MIYNRSTISLVVQLVVLCLLLIAILLKYRKKYRQHGIIMFSAVVLHLVVILIVMVPSFTAFFSDPSLIDYTDILTITSFVHGFSGLAVALLGVWILGSWRLQTNLKACFRKKRYMDLTIILWSLVLILGVVLYLAITQVI